MPFILAAKVWHYWVGAALFIPVVLATIAMGVGYLVKVVSPRYPRQ
ncbi:MAG TPA: hypothetical protein VMY34_06940 [Acidimicrobiales bacterium]|nr:hypothetical protein [Acidimicrobiales bacterium]